MHWELNKRLLFDYADKYYLNEPKRYSGTLRSRQPPYPGEETGSDSC